jgi:hypothetical protein
VACGRRQRVRWIDLAVLSRCAGLEEELLHARRAEDHDSSPGLRADVAARMDDAREHVHRLAGNESRPVAVDIHLELAFHDVDRLG